MKKKKHFLPFIILFTFPLLLATYTFLKYNNAFKLSHLLCYPLFLVFIIPLIRLIKNKLFFSIVILTNSSFFFLSAFIDYFHIKFFNSRVSKSTLHIILETNKNESLEFLSNYYLQKDLILLTIIHLILSIIGFYSLLKNTPYRQFKSQKKEAIFLSILALITIVFIRNSFLPYTILRHSIKYHKDRQFLSSIKISKKGNFKNVISAQTNKQQTYVLIIGESTAKSHLNLYDYERNNTPLLCELNLKKFKNVICPHTHTSSSLGKVLTLGDYDIPEKKYNSTIIQLFNNAGFETYFISNQKPIGIYETSTLLISKTSDHNLFKNVADNTFDEVLFNPIDRVLKEKKKKKFIIIHLMGTHIQYSKRYPNNFDIFKNKPNTLFKHELAYKTINEYDNAILYNDYIVSNIIKKVEQETTQSFVLYISDHGEDVYETINNACHSEDMGTKPMFEIPFILWQSQENKKQTNDLIFDIERNFNTENLIHSLSDLSKIKFERFEPKKSIFNPLFFNKKNNY